MFNSNGYSLADIAAATGGNKNNDGFMNDGWWIILLFLFGGWGNGNGWGSGARGGAGSEIAYGFDMNGLENGVRGIQQGLCDGFYAMNTGMLTGFSNVGQTICTSTNALENGIQAIGSQLAACCCDLKGDVTRGFSDLGYALATQSCQTRQAIADSTRDIIDSNNNGVKAILDFLIQDKIGALTAENQALKFAASQAAQNNYLISALGQKVPVPAYVVANPYSGNACGCNNF